MIPFVWAEEAGGVNDELAEELKTMLINPLSYAETGIAGFALISTFTFIFLLLLRVLGGNGARKKVATTDSVESLVRIAGGNASLPQTTPPPPPPMPPMLPQKLVSVQTPDRLLQSNGYVHQNAHSHNNGFVHNNGFPNDYYSQQNNGYPNPSPYINDHANGTINRAASQELKRQESMESTRDSNRDRGVMNDRFKKPENDPLRQGVWTTGTGQFVNSNYNSIIRGSGNGNLVNGNDLNRTETIEGSGGRDNLLEELSKNRSFRKRQQSQTSHGSNSSKSSTSIKTVTISQDMLRNSYPDQPKVEVVEESLAKREELEGLFEPMEVKDEGYDDFTRRANTARHYPDYIEGLEDFDESRKAMHDPAHTGA